MKKLILVTATLILCGTSAYNQPGLEVEGSIQISESENTTPEPGTIRWTGLKFEGWNGVTWASFTSFEITSIITDSDGNEYRTVTIGNQEWMAENLRTSRFTDGSEIPMVNDQAAWLNANYGVWCWYDTLNINDVPYGKLYNWYAVNDTRGVCPTGWHVPTDAEWTTLIDYLDPVAVNPDVNGIQSSVAGGKMKETGTAHWQSPNAGATNERGFTAMPGGFRNSSNGSFSSLGYGGHWWSDTEDGGNVWYRLITYSSGNIARFNGSKSGGFAVRCLRN
jgi:uncharacterized protein (TIGR02145 family)